MNGVGPKNPRNHDWLYITRAGRRRMWLGTALLLLGFWALCIYGGWRQGADMLEIVIGSGVVLAFVGVFFVVGQLMTIRYYKRRGM